MRKLLENALESGDIVELEKAIVTAHNEALAALNSRHGNSSLNDILLKCRKTLVLHLEECGPLLRPLRRACRNLDEEALRAALLKAHLASPVILKYMRSDIQQAESLLQRMRRAEEEAQELLNCTDWREIEHFLDAKTAMLPDRTVVALMRRREALFAQRRVVSVDPALSMPKLSSPPFQSRSVRVDNHEAILAIMCQVIEREEEHRRTVLDEEHSQRVLCLKYVMEAMSLLVLDAEGGLGILNQCDVRRVNIPMTQGEMKRSFSPPRNVVSVDNSTALLPESSAATPNLSPIKLSSLVDSALRTDQRPTMVGANTAVVTDGRRSDFVMTRETASLHVLQEQPSVLSPRVVAQLGAVAAEEEIRRRDVEGCEEFERSVFLLPMSARSALLTRLLPRWSVSRRP